MVGANGIGKSSLMALLLGQLHEDRGECVFPTDWRIAQVAQHMPDSESSATDFVLEGDRVLMAAHAALAAAEAAQDGHAMAEAHAALAQAGSFDARSRAQTLLMGLGFTVGQLDSPVNSFSGGWRMRLQLARALMAPSDLLLLDEPTNHLDLATREALSMALNEFEGTVMLVSHDRALLRAVCDEFWMVGRGKVEPFDGDLDDYQHYLLEESKRLREEAKAGAAAAAKPTEAMAVPVAPSPVNPAEPAASTAPSLSAGEQRKQDAQRRQQLAAQTRPLKKELDQNEQRMAAIEQEKAALESQLSSPLPPAEIAQAGRRLKALTDEIALLEERWMELSEQLQQMQA